MCTTHFISHAPCGHLTNSLPRSLAGHCKALDAALRFYHSQPERPPLPGGMVMPRVCASVRGEGSALRFWPVPWGCGRGEDALCRVGWGAMYCPWVPGEAQRASVFWERENTAGRGRVSANVSSNLRVHSVTSPALEPGHASLSAYSNLTPPSPINFKLDASAKTTKLNPPEAQFWGWGWWTDPRTGEIAPPPSVAVNTAAPHLVPTATRDNISLGEKNPKLRMIWPGRCIVDGDVGGVYCR